MVWLYTDPSFIKTQIDNIMRNHPHYKLIVKTFRLLTSCLVLMTFYEMAFSQVVFTNDPVQLAKLKQLQTRVEQNPGNLKAHEDFIRALDEAEPYPYLRHQYSLWMKQFPKSATVIFALGKSLKNRNSPEGRDFLLKALNLNPNIAEAWNLLASDAVLSGDNLLMQEYAAKAKKADPKNPDYAFTYALSFAGVDSAKFDSLLIALVFRFPESETAASALLSLASNSNIESEKMAFFEQLYQRYSTKPWRIAEIGMEAYFNFLLNRNPQKAFEIALNMSLEPKVNHYLWNQKIVYARSFRGAKEMLELNKPLLALEILKSLQADFKEDEKFVLMKSQAIENAAGTKVAYDSLSRHYSTRPGKNIRIKLLEYARTLNKDENQFNLDIESFREASARQATDFSLEPYSSSIKTSLGDYKGKVTLLTYWFPACGPCHQEFPHFESVMKKFDKENVAYLGINIVRNQDPYVLPSIKSKGYTFIPLKEEDRDKGNLDNTGSAPVNFLIDKKGRVIFSNFRIDENNTDMLELMISNLLEQKVE